MGVVWRARDPRLDRWVALKVMRVDTTEGSAGRLRLLREAQAMARLAHPNVVAVHDVGEVGDGVFVAMELVEGEDLAQWLSARRRTWREIVPVFVAAGRGLAAAHAAGLVHRDFKPANVLVGKDGRARVTDFGLARSESAPPETGAGVPSLPSPDLLESGEGLATPLTLAGTVMGTPPFMAPEQLEGRAVDARADQFSFCVSLWDALHGALPYPGQDPRELRRAIALGPPKDAADRRGVPSWLSGVLRRGLSEDCGRRWPSMDALVAALERGMGRRRRIVLGTVAAVAATGWLSSVLLSARAPPGPCSSTPSSPWESVTREAVRQAFAATGKPFSADAFIAADRALSATATQLREERERACAPQRRGGPSDEERVLRLGCLDLAREDLAATAGVLRQADAETVQQLTEVLKSLPDARTCSEQRRLLQAPRLPGDPGERARYLELRGKIAEASALDLAGKKERGQAMLREALPVARAGRWGRLEATALMTLARSLTQTKHHDEGLATVWDAWLAAEAAGDDWLAAQAAVVGVNGASDRLGDVKEAERWARIAEAILKRTEDLDTLLRLSYARANLLRSAGEFEKALALARSTLERSLTRPELAKSVASDARTLIASLLGDLGRFDEAVPLRREVLAGSLEVHGPHHPETAFAYDGLARELYNVQRYDEAAPLSRTALEIYDSTLGESALDTAGALDTAAAIARDSGDLEGATRYARRAVKAYETSVGLDAVQASITVALLGDVLQETGHLEEGERLLRRAIAAQEKGKGPEREMLSESLRALGDCLLSRGRAKEAVAVLTRALAEQERASDPGATAWVRFRLAAARWEAKLDRPAARRSVEQALAAFPTPPDPARKLDLREAAEMRAWLAGHQDPAKPR
jgi:serine/threonine protein kinase/tetratricopeptide (TPR) repeat protein